MFHLKAQLAGAGDQTRDPSRPWPDNRQVVDLAVLTLDKPVADSLEAQQKAQFNIMGQQNAGDANGGS